MNDQPRLRWKFAGSSRSSLCFPLSYSRRPTAAMALPVWQDLDKTHQVIIAAALGLALALVAVVRLQPSPCLFPLSTNSP